MPLYSLACRYPLNMAAITPVCSKIATLLLSCVGPYHPPRSDEYPGKEQVSARPTKKRRMYYRSVNTQVLVMVWYAMVTKYLLDCLASSHSHHEGRPEDLAARDPDRRADVLELDHLRGNGTDNDTDVEVGVEPVALVAIEVELVNMSAHLCQSVLRGSFSYLRLPSCR
jgi:hypothetical protein